MTALAPFPVWRAAGSLRAAYVRGLITADEFIRSYGMLALSMGERDTAACAFRIVA